VDYAVLHGLNRSVPKMDYLSGHAENNSRNLGPEYLTKRLTEMFCMLVDLLKNGARQRAALAE
jgi:hypothetical protein